MEFTFELGRSVEMTFDLGGIAPQPAPTMPIVECTQAEYDAMQSHDPGALYAIPEVI